MKLKNKLIKILWMLVLVFLLVPTFLFFIPTKKNRINLSNNSNVVKNIKTLTPNTPNTLDELRKLSVDEIVSLKKLDMRNYNVVTSVKNQGNQGICWAYSFAATSEVNMLYKQNVLDANYNNSNFSLSCKKIDSSVNIRTKDTDVLKLTEQDVFRHQLGNGALSLFHQSQIMMQQNSLIIGNPNSLSGEKAAWLQSIINIPNDVQEIKKTIAKYGAVTFAYKSSNLISYYATSDIYNHAATIVGWDDDYDKNKFGPTKPSRNGAWIVKNSWGSNVFDNGYFYLSYDSKIFDIVSFDYVNKNKYENTYYYDGMARIGESQEIGNKKVAAIFPVKRATYNVVEKLKGISFGLIGKNAKVKATVYTNVEANPINRYSQLNNPESGIKVLEQVSEVYPNSIEFGGQYTLEFNKEIELQPGTYFSIVLEPINDNNSAKVLFSSEPRSTNDLTFFENSDKWLNCSRAGLSQAEYNVAIIKALTITTNKEATKNNDLLYSDVSFNEKSFVYDGDIKPSPIVKYENNNLRENQDYLVEWKWDYKTDYDYPNQVGTLITTIKGLNNYNGIKKIYSTIDKGEKPKLDLNGIGYFDNKNEIAYINVKSRFNQKINRYYDIKLPEGWQFESDGELKDNQENNNKIEYKKYDAKFYKKTKFAVKVNREIVVDNINDATNGITWDLPFYYTGKEIVPNIELKFNNELLVQGVDYEISYENNIKVGQANILISGINYFINSKKSIGFEIIKAQNKINVVDGKLQADFGELKRKYYKDPQCTIEINSLEELPNNSKYWVKFYADPTENWTGVESQPIEQIYTSGQLPNPSENNAQKKITIILISTIVPISSLIIISLITIVLVKKFKK